MMTLLSSFNRLKEALQTDQTTLVIYRAVAFFANLRQEAVEAIATIQSDYNDDTLDAFLRSLESWYESLAERICLDKVMLMSNSEEIVAFYRSMPKHPESRHPWSEEYILMDITNSLRSVTVGMPGSVKLLEHECIIDQSAIEILEEYAEIFCTAHRLLRNYLAKFHTQLVHENEKYAEEARRRFQTHQS